jgi:hypothetical protein
MPTARDHFPFRDAHRVMQHLKVDVFGVFARIREASTFEASIFAGNDNDAAAAARFINNYCHSQWRFEPFGQGYSICNVSTGLYMTSEAGVNERSPVVASLFQTTWPVGLSGNDSRTVWLVGYLSCETITNCLVKDRLAKHHVRS